MFGSPSGTWDPWNPWNPWEPLNPFDPWEVWSPWDPWDLWETCDRRVPRDSKYPWTPWDPWDHWNPWSPSGPTGPGMAASFLPTDDAVAILARVTAGSTIDGVMGSGPRIPPPSSEIIFSIKPGVTRMRAVVRSMRTPLAQQQGEEGIPWAGQFMVSEARSSAKDSSG